MEFFLRDEGTGGRLRGKKMGFEGVGCLRRVFTLEGSDERWKESNNFFGPDLGKKKGGRGGGEFLGSGRLEEMINYLLAAQYPPSPSDEK